MAVDDSYTKALLHFNGSDDGTTFTDESGKTWTAEGGAVTDTDRKKFGSAAGLFAGGSDCRITTPDHADFTFDADFTIDAWFYCENLPGNYARQTIYQHAQTGAATNNINLGIYNDASSTLAEFSVYSGSMAVIYLVGTTPVTVDTWHHIAISRSGTTWKLFLDGNAEADTTDAASIPDCDYTPAIGAYRNTSDAAWYNEWDGSIDEFRLSKGIARWTSSFTPETGEYVVTVSGDISDSFSVSEVVSEHVAELNVTISDSFSVSAELDDAAFLEEITDSFSVSSSAEDEISVFAETETGLSLPSLTLAGTTNTSTTLAVELDSPFFTIEAYTGDALGGYFPVITIDGEAKTGEVGSGASDFPAMTAIGYTGAVLDTNLWTPYDIALSAGATTNTASNLDQNLPSLTSAGHAYVELLCTLAENLPRLRSAAVALLDVRTNTNAQIPKYSLSGYSYNGYLADLAADIPGFNISATGYESGGAVALAESLPSLWLVSVAHGGQTGYYSVPVMNVRKGAISEWNLGFNSITYFNGKTVATDGTKIYEIGSTVDDVSTPDADITSSIKTGNLDLANNAKIRFTDAYANVKADGNVKLQFELDESTTYDFTMTMHDLDDTHEEKVNLGKGMKARVYAVSLYNIDGSKFRLNRLQLIGDKLD